ncbi:unnamed protein product [Lymnaea stagnalis]|uniref:Uncharacterized protein n=1 Tax=Lymnaea stagnalis TaxID=6523 RepID=A0AAV2HWT2_LYMST
MEGASPGYSKVVELGLKTSQLSHIHILCVLQTGHTCSEREEGYPCYCDSVDDDKTSHLVFNITATTSVSQADIRLQVSHINKSQIFSETRSLPEIFEKTESIQINDLVPDTDSCFLKLNTSDDVINSCCHNMPQPCVSTIYRNGLKVASSDVCSSYQAREFSAWASIYKFTVSVCGDEHFVKPVTCIAEHGEHLSQNADESLDFPCRYTAAIFRLTIAILLLLLLMVLIQTSIIFHRLRDYCARKKEGTQSRNIHF